MQVLKQLFEKSLQIFQLNIQSLLSLIRNLKCENLGESHFHQKQQNLPIIIVNTKLEIFIAEISPENDSLKLGMNRKQEYNDNKADRRQEEEDKFKIVRFRNLNNMEIPLIKAFLLNNLSLKQNLQANS
ncbi:hypothetical protein ABPG73_011759 [Tetrahymena malaccensis]